MDVKLPNLGEGADSGTIVSILVKEGDQIQKDQTILELENEKAVAPIPSPQGGRIEKIHVKEGDKINVGQNILSLSSGDGEAAGEEESAEEKPKAKKKASKRREPEPEEQEEEEEEEEEEPEESTETVSTEVAAAPSIRKIARDIGLDLHRIKGSARGGRIVLEDIRRYIQRLQKLASQKSKSAAEGRSTPAPQQIDFSQWGEIAKKPMSQLRQVISRRMSENWNAVPHVTQFDDADITSVMELRKKHQKAYEEKGAHLTLTPFVLKAVVDTLKKHPVFNSSLDEVAQEIVYKEYFHVGIAVDTDAGLLVPVIRDVDKKSMFDLSKELEQLAAKARDRKISAEEMKGGTFTISNQGGIGGAHFTPIVNKPEVAILGLGRGSKKPVVAKDKIEPRLLLPLGLSYDHRVIDGGTAARFITDLVQILQNFPEDQVKL